MGRIKTTLTKRTARKLMETHGEEFKPDFAENKLILPKFIDVSNKKIRNIIAGYVTRLVKQQLEQ